MDKRLIRVLLLIGFFAVLSSCNPKDKKTQETVNISNRSFDVASLKMNEDVNSILKSAGQRIQDTISTDEITLIGNEKMAFSSDKLLMYDGKNLQGKNTFGTNEILLYYGKVDKEIGSLANEENDKLGMYQLNIFTKSEKKLLKDQLLKALQKPFFDTIIQGMEFVAKANDVVETGNKFKQEVSIWKNKVVVYYYIVSEIDNKPEENKCKLFVFKNKEWKNFLKGSGYSQTDKILY